MRDEIAADLAFIALAFCIAAAAVCWRAWLNIRAKLDEFMRGPK